MVLLDTNILTRSVHPAGALHTVAVAAVETLKRRGNEPTLVPQVLYEFWVVATRPEEQNGLGMTTAEARGELACLRTLFPMQPDIPAIYAEWERLMATHDVRGKPAHDARLVAAMLVHGIGGILTFNPADFVRYRGITVLNALDLAPQGAAPPDTPGP